MTGVRSLRRLDQTASSPATLTTATSCAKGTTSVTVRASPAVTLAVRPGRRVRSGDRAPALEPAACGRVAQPAGPTLDRAVGSVAAQPGQDSASHVGQLLLLV